MAKMAPTTWLEVQSSEDPVAHSHSLEADMLFTATTSILAKMKISKLLLQVTMLKFTHKFLTMKILSK